MKRLVIYIGALMAGVSCLAQGAAEPTITMVEGGMQYGGLLPLDISDNGRYISGSTFVYAGFISDWSLQETKVFLSQDGSVFDTYGCELSSVNNLGSAVGFDDGGPVMASLPDDSFNRLSISGVPDAMTSDGSIIVGMTYTGVESDYQNPHKIAYQACYWENGTLHLLPVPSEEELGFYYLGTRARCVSSDGSVIMGVVVDRLYLNPMILWRRQANGSYKLDAVCEKYFSDIKYNDGTLKEYVMFRGNAMSRNGAKIALSVRLSSEYGPTSNPEEHLAIYDVATGEIARVDIDGKHGITPGTKLEVNFNGISDAGTVVGRCEGPHGGSSGFIMFADEMQPRYLADVFNDFGQLVTYDEETGDSGASAITPDGRYITGFGWFENSTMGYYECYVIDRGSEDADASVGSVEMSTTGNIEYYDLQGRRIPSMQKGINIVRMPDGKVVKKIGR